MTSAGGVQFKRWLITCTYLGHVSRTRATKQPLSALPYSRDHALVQLLLCNLLALRSSLPLNRFYSASALLARLSVCLSVTFRYCVQMNEDTMVRFSASGSKIPLVSGEVKFIQILAVDHTLNGVIAV